MQRQVSLYEEYKQQFPNIYKDRVAEYLKMPKQNYDDDNQRVCRTVESPNPR